MPYDYFQWLNQEAAISRRTMPHRTDTRYHGGRRAPFAFDVTRGAWIGDVLVPHAVSLDDVDQHWDQIIEAAERMMADPRWDGFSFAERPLTNVEMWAMTIASRHGLLGVANRWLDQLYDWLEDHNGESIARNKIARASSAAAGGVTYTITASENHQTIAARSACADADP